nr:hypothetical protein [Tanacetum cinerariifolium]
MEQYLAHTNYALWEVILNGNSAIQMTKDEVGNEIEVLHVTAQQILARTRERKAKSTLLMAISDEHLARFHGIKDAKTLWAAIKTRFGHSSQAQGSSSYADEIMFSFFATQSNTSKLDNEDLEQIDQDYLEKIDLKWQVAMLFMREKRFYKKTKIKLEFNGKEPIDFDKTKVECYNCHRRGHFARDCRSARNSGNRSRDVGNAWISLQILQAPQAQSLREGEVTETVFDNRSSDEENSLASDMFKKGKGYHAVPPPLIGKYMPPKSDLSFAGLDDSIYKFKISETVTSLAKKDKDAPETSTASVEKPKEYRSTGVSVKHVKPVDSVKHVNPVKFVNIPKQTKKSKHFSSCPKIDRKDWNGKMTQKLELGFGFTKKVCFVCGSMSHLIKDCTFHEDGMAKKSVLPTNVGKGTVFTRSGRIPVSAAKPKAAASTSAAKPVNTVGPKQSVNFSKSRSTFHKSDSPIRRSFYNATTHSRRNSTKRVNIVGSKAVSAVKRNGVTAIKTSKGCVWRSKGHPQQALKNKGIVDSGCSRHMTGNKAYLTDYQEIYDRGFVAFGLSRGKILASIDESNLWHRRLGHVNFKTMNKLVKGNLVRCLPLKIFENDHTCVACQKEAVNTVYYVLNRALVTKTHNKTPYEHLNGRTPRLDFMRPFGFPVTILNTLDPLGKFKGKADEGFLVGYSVTSKAFRVFNTKSRKVKENLHVRESNRQKCRSTYTNGNAGTQDNVDTRKEVFDQHYNVFPLWSFISFTFKSSDDKATDDKPTDDTGLKTVKEPINKEDQTYKDELDRLMSQEKDAINVASTSGTFSDVGPSSPHLNAFIPANTLLHVDQDDSQIPDLEDIAKLQSTGIFNSTYDDDLDIFDSPVQSVGAEPEFNNMESSTTVSLIPTHRVHLDHPKDQILGDPKSTVQTKGMAKKSSRAHTLVSYIHKQRRTNHKDYDNCLFSCFLSQMEPKKVYKNKNDERGIVVRNKARLVAQGHKQEEGIDYDEVFSPVARIEAIRIFLAFASYMGFIVYHMDVKSAFLYSIIDEEVYVCQSPGFIDPRFPNKVYKLEKALYDLHQAPRAWYETLSTFLLQNGYIKGTINKTLFIKKDKDYIMLILDEFHKGAYILLRTAGKAE